MQRLRNLVIAVLVAAAQPVAASETTDQGVFDFHLLGIKAGVFAYKGVRNETSYAVTGRLESAGLVSFVKQIRYDAKARGRVGADGRLVPRRYEEDADTGKRQSRSLMEYEDGVPTVVRPERQRARDVDPATQGGTLDPLSALYAVFRDMPREEVCALEIHMFDGKRRSRVQLSEPTSRDDRVVCAGEYRRLAGFSKREMAEKQRFAFTLTYAPAGDGQMRVRRVEMETEYGPATLTRR